MKLFLLLPTLLIATAAIGQTLPATTRTVYKCEIEGKVHYSDSPCLGAMKVDVEPTRGLNRSTGKELQGRDVRREHFREGIAEMVKPVTGLNAKQLDQAGRRQKLSPDAQRQCRALDRQLPAAQTEVAAKTDPERAAAQKHLFDLRVAYRSLRCE